MWPGADRGPTGPWTCYRLDLGLLHIVPSMQNSRHGALHSASLVNAGLGLKVTGGL